MSLSYLEDFVRLQIGDLNPATYRYTSEWVLTSLQLAVKILQRYWNYRYLIDDAGEVTRNPNTTFLFPETDGIIQKGDEYPIILMAAIILLEGSLENNSWDAVSWRDNEIQFSNLEKYRTKGDMLRRLVDMLNGILLPPVKKLARAKVNSLPGYLNNQYERNINDPK